MVNAEVVRAEEVEISAPGGASVRALIDATPIHAAGGADADTVERVVVTLQDLAPFEALERSRAEFLELVSHELRAPLAAIRGSAQTALEDPREADRDELAPVSAHRGGAGRADVGADRRPAGRRAHRRGARCRWTRRRRRSRTSSSGRGRRSRAGGGRHTVTVEAPEGLRVMADARRVVQVLANLFDNAARHSVETAPILVSAARDGAEVSVSVTDGGEGIPAERLPHLFRRHAGTGQDGGARGGSGLGLVICKGLVEAHGGRIRAESAGRRPRDVRDLHPAGGGRGGSGAPRRGPAGGAGGRRCWWWTTTRSRCARRARRWRRRATTRRRRPSPRTSRACWRRSARRSRCSTWCCPVSTASS